MNSERRSTHRERTEDLCYIQFKPEGGGIVVNASQQGLAFHAASAVLQPGPMRLCISPNPMQRIELTAEIVWIDGTKKFGGLRFTELTADARNQIGQWLTQTRKSQAPDGNLVSPSCAPKEEAAHHAHTRNETPDLPPAIPALDNAQPLCADSRSVSSRRVGSDLAAALRPAQSSQEMPISIHHPRFLRGLATGFLIFVSVFMPILFLQNFHREIGNSLILLGEKLVGKSNTPPDASSSIPVQISDPSPQSAPFVPDPIPEIPPNETLDQSDPAVAVQTTEGTANSTDSHFADRQNARQHLADAPLGTSRNALARQLWSAVQAGDSSAEVALAEMYLKGDGVPRSCEQARVLLRAASKSGNIEAQQRLRRLHNNTCR